MSALPRCYRCGGAVRQTLVLEITSPTRIDQCTRLHGRAADTIQALPGDTEGDRSHAS